ncbi:MAG TPA: YdeI/OmpD-associated family protein [Pyrinomonadaceae bacterium]|nr:YdeI/OmpD-associated family protein [Pyrinomonadaceae bacterium]
MKKQISVVTKVIRHNPQFSRLVTIPLDDMDPWKLTGTATVEGTINGVELGRRSLKRWDDRNCWWIDLPEPLCKKAKLEEGDEVQLTIRLASEDLPEELQQLLKTNSVAKANWEKLTQPQQRMLREDVFAAKTSAARRRRAEKFLI